MGIVNIVSARSLTEAEVVTVDAAKFREVTLQYEKVKAFACRYAQEFMARCNDRIKSGGSMWDVPEEFMPHFNQGEEWNPEVRALRDAEMQEASFLDTRWKADLAGDDQGDSDDS